MPLTTKYVPFGERHIHGIIRTIASDTNSKNVSSDGFVSISASSTEIGYPSLILLDNPHNAYWHTKPSDEEMWFIIDFGLFRVEIEGYTIYTGNGDYRSQWNISASDDGKNWELIDEEGVEAPNTEWTKSYRTNVTTLRYFKMQAGGEPVDPNSTWLAIYSFDIFGKLIVPSSINYISIHCHHINIRVSLFYIMLFAK